MSDLLLQIAEDLYTFGRSDKGEPLALPKSGANVAKFLRGAGSGASLRAELAHRYTVQLSRAPSSNALADALLALEGRAMLERPQIVPVRVAPESGAVLLDLGTESGKAVRISPASSGLGWELLERSPIPFRRSILTGPLPPPIADGDVDELAELLNLPDESFGLAVAWLVAALIPDVAKPPILFGGEMGTGKSTAGAMLAGIIDPAAELASKNDLRSPPRDVPEWAITAAASLVVPIDNVSVIPQWWSDALCLAVTGGSLIRRSLYTDDAISKVAFQRAIILTSIDIAVLRSDFGERLLKLDLERIAPTERRSDDELWAMYHLMRPRVLGAILTLCSRVLQIRREIKLPAMPRMADFARVLAACDQVRSRSDLSAYIGQAGRIAEDVYDADLIAPKLSEFIHALDPKAWTGTAGELLAAIKPNPVPKGWPANPKGLSSHLRRIAPALRAVGFRIEPPREDNRAKGTRARIWTIAHIGTTEPADTAASPKAAEPPAPPWGASGESESLLGPPSTDADPPEADHRWPDDPPPPDEEPNDRDSE